MRKVKSGITDLITPVKNYKGKWVILSEDNKKVLVAATTAEAVLKKAAKLGIKKGSIMSVPKQEYDHYIGWNE